MRKRDILSPVKSVCLVWDSLLPAAPSRPVHFSLPHEVHWSQPFYCFSPPSDFPSLCNDERGTSCLRFMYLATSEN